MVGANPFQPGSGERPPVMAGRAELLAVLGDAFGTGRIPGTAPLVFAGRALMGRTVLVDAAEDAARDAEWPTFRVNARPGADLGRALADAFEDSTGVPMPRPDVRRVLRGMIQLLEDEATPGIAILVDDVDQVPLDQAAEFLRLVGQAMGNDLPVVAVVSSLPSWPDTLLSHDAEVAIQVVALGPLDAAAVRDAVVGPATAAGVSFGADALDALVRRCRGIPAFVQMLAHHAVGSSRGMTISLADVTRAAIEAEHAAVEAFYRPIHNALAPSQRRFLRALRQAGEGSNFDTIRRHLGEFARFESAASPARQACDELLRAGVIFAGPDGRLFFSIAGYAPFVDTVD